MQVDAVRSRQVLVDDAFVPATIIIRDGRIDAVAPYDRHVPGTTIEAPCVLHGVVDTHVHVNEPGRTEWEGFVSATVAATLGGVTTLVDMPLNSVPPTTTVAGCGSSRRRRTASWRWTSGSGAVRCPATCRPRAALGRRGLGFKCFLSPSGVDEFPPLTAPEFHAALAEVARLDALMVVHAEDAAVLAAAPAPPSRAYQDFVLSRPDQAETAAIRQVLDGARETGARVHVLHLSSARALDLLADARAEGLRVTVETCPHYLCFTAESIPDAAPAFKCCPPIRDAGNRDELWQALTAG